MALNRSSALLKATQRVKECIAGLVLEDGVGFGEGLIHKAAINQDGETFHFEFVRRGTTINIHHIGVTEVMAGLLEEVDELTTDQEQEEQEEQEEEEESGPVEEEAQEISAELSSTRTPLRRASAVASCPGAPFRPIKVKTPRVREDLPKPRRLFGAGRETLDLLELSPFDSRFPRSCPLCETRTRKFFTSKQGKPSCPLCHCGPYKKPISALTSSRRFVLFPPPTPARRPRPLFAPKPARKWRYIPRGNN
jgi:hypothetical protein